MIDANTFHRSIQEISNLSERLGDAWVLHDNHIPQNAFISKKLKIQSASWGLLTFEYHIIYNISYSVPVLLFNAYKSDGLPITNIDDCHHLFNIPLQSPSTHHILMQQEHPHSYMPFLAFHPCKTSEIMEAFANKTQNPVVSWISAIGPHVHLNISAAYSELTFKK